ncbi:MAG: amidohydrolase [Bifidobacteriaceae bacterium]|jgi:predicted amidohydrolase YtcJ|nr:amidohydrolase [Bifidobacteriaceae bacterium]
MANQAFPQFKPASGADLILRGGDVWAGLAPDLPAKATALAISGGVIVGVGDDDAVAPWQGTGTQVIELGGRRVVPGLIDSHLHAIRGASTWVDELDWTGVDTLSEGLASVRAAAAERGPGAWIEVLGGWYPAQFADDPRMPTPAELTAAAPNNPVFVHPLYGYDDHAVLNRRGLEVLGWAGPMDDPAQGTLDRDATGAPNGIVRGLPMYAMIAARAGTPGLAREAESSRAFFERLAAVGLTGVVDAGGLGMSPDKYRAVRALWRLGRLPIRVRTNLCPVNRGSEPAEIDEWERMLDPGLGDDLLSVLGLGEVVHFGCHDWEGMSPFPIDDADFALFVESLKKSARLRWPVTIHAILATSVAKVIDGIELAAQDASIEGLRWSLQHVECISEHDLQRVKALGLGLGIQGRLSQKMNVVADRWGEETARGLLPLGRIVDLGIPFGAGTDGSRAASYHPWQSLWFLVSGRNRSGGPERHAANRLDRAQALHAYTRGSAWFSFEEDRRGFLAPGALGDLAVLDRDYFAVPQDEIPSVRSVLTLVGGKVVHRSDEFSGLELQCHAQRPGPAPYEV